MRVLLGGLIEIGCHGIDCLGFVFKNFPEDHNLFAGLVPLSLLNRFPYRWKGFHIIAGIDTRGIKLVPVPGPSGQALRPSQFSLSLNHQLIHLGTRSIGQSIATVALDCPHCLLEVLGASFKRGNPVVDRRKIQKGREDFGLRFHKRLFRIGSCVENAFLDFGVQLL